MDICQQEYAIAKEYPGVSLPDCQALPRIGTKESENCTRIGIPSVKAVTGELTGMSSCFPENESQSPSASVFKSWPKPCTR